MEQLPNNTKERENDFSPNISKILEKSEKFHDYRNKIRYAGISFLNDKNIFDGFLEKGDFSDFIRNTEKTKLDTKILSQKILQEKQEHGIDFVFEKYFKLLENENNHEQNSSKQNFGIIEFYEDNKDNHIHLGKENIKNGEKIGIQESFSLFCDYLAQQEILPEKISGRSWLLANPYLRERMAFEKEKEYIDNLLDPEKTHFGLELWGQIIDENNQIKKKELEYLYKNNAFRYPVTEASIPIQKLFEKFGKNLLRKEYKYESLDNYKYEKEIMWRKEQALREYLQNNFAVEGLDGFLDFISDSAMWNDFLKTELGKEFTMTLALMEQKIEQENITLAEVFQKYGKDYAEILENTRDYLNTKEEEYLEQFKETKTFSIEEEK